MQIKIAAWTATVALAFMAMVPAAAKVGIQPLMYLAGEWAGEGWVDMGKGRMAFRQSERITPRLNGNIITIEGTGRDPEDAKTVVFEAFAVLSATGKPGQYEMRSYTREGQSGTFPAVLEAPGKMVWTIPVADSAHFSREARRAFQLSAHQVAAYLATIQHGRLRRP